MPFRRQFLQPFLREPRRIAPAVTLDDLLQRGAGGRQVFLLELRVAELQQGVGRLARSGPAFADRAKEAGVDGVLVVDYPPEEAARKAAAACS